MVGAVTVLIAIVAVFLAYNANSGLPFVPVYRVSVDIPNAARMTPTTRSGSAACGSASWSRSTRCRARTDTATAATEHTDGRARAAADRGTAEPEARQDRRAAAAGLDLPRPLPLGVRPQVPRDRARRGPPAPEGHVFDGTDDGELCDLPTDGGQFASSIPEESRNGCFQGQTEFDEINDTFDNRRPAARSARTWSATEARLRAAGCR